MNNLFYRKNQYSIDLSEAVVRHEKVLYVSEYIEDGDIKEKGNHKELLKKRSIYYSLYNLQFPDMNIIM